MGNAESIHADPNGNVITRAALGKVASLGDLYDARQDNFCGANVFNDTIPEQARTQTDVNLSDAHVVHTDDFLEKCSKLGVGTDLQASIISGLTKPEGFGQFVCDNKQSVRSVKMSLLYNIKTQQEMLNLVTTELKECISPDTLLQQDATHVVVGITWGANLVMSCLYDIPANLSTSTFKGSLSTELEKIRLGLSVKKSIDKVNLDIKDIKLKIRLFCDVFAPNEGLPTTASSCLQLMEELPELIKVKKNGKGSPVSYRLLPLTLLKKYYSLPISNEPVYVSIPETILYQFVQIFDQFATAQQEIRDISTDAVENKQCISSADLMEIVDLRDTANSKVLSFKDTFSKYLEDIRAGKKEMLELTNLLVSLHDSQFSPRQLFSRVKAFSPVLKKIEFVHNLHNYGAKYVSSMPELNNEFATNSDKKFVVFFFNLKNVLENSEEWRSNKRIFFLELQDKYDRQHIAFDCEFHPETMSNGCHSCVQLYSDGRIVIQDMLMEEIKLSNAPVAKPTNQPHCVKLPPRKRVPLRINCTGISCNGALTYDWICKNCKSNIEYGFDAHVYCNCGKSLASDLAFKCIDQNHGTSFQKRPEKDLFQALDSLRPTEEMNILILGETGVGKSTWINGFRNFLAYNLLRDAEEGELHTLIPSQFTVCNQDLEETLVTTGTDENEVMETGQSGTQNSKVYPFVVDNTIIRLIDTPGIGDVRGIEQDKINFQNILGTLACLEKINGICILLKPNNPTLSLMFRFCIKELLTYLHRDASKNIVFCFTNTQGTSYKPGDTLPALRKLLSENMAEISLSSLNVYCFDNEAYRYLAAIKNEPKVTFSENQVKHFDASWSFSMGEIGRMLKYIQSLRPHSVKNTLNLNHARSLVIKLARPLAEISRMIQANKSEVEAKIKEIEKAEESIEALTKKQKIRRTELEVTQLDYPKTVCKHNDCVQYLEQNGVSVVYYKTICHKKCKTTKVKRESVGELRLYKCSAISLMGYCTRKDCGHHYTDHVHIYYDSIQVVKEVQYKAVTDCLKEKLSAKQVKQKIIDELNKQIREYKHELKKIEQASVKFACFLKVNAITPYNDEMEQYLDHLIQEEEQKVGNGDSNNVLETLQQRRASYTTQKQHLESEMAKEGAGAKALGPADVEKLVKELKSLKHSGVALQESLNCLDYIQKAVYNEYIENVPVVISKQK